MIYDSDATAGNVQQETKIDMGITEYAVRKTPYVTQIKERKISEAHSLIFI
jgi:hypothetical protein